MTKILPIALLLATVIIADAALALARNMHHLATQGSSRHLASELSESALLRVRSGSEDQGRRSLFEICQHQDPTTPAVRFGISGCFALPY